MIIIEPHADDAFLSLGGIIERETKAGNPVAIVTVYSGTRKRASDAADYATAVGAAWYGLGMTEMGNAKVNGPAPIDLETLRYQMDPIWKENPRRTLVLPLAITHPEHVEVRLRFEQLLGAAHCYYYLDQPYASKLKNQEAVRTALKGLSIVDYFRPGAAKYRHAKLFKDQSKFFHFNPPTELEMKGIELVVE